MRILQLIDSLNPGGAERMAVNYANALSEKDHKSFLICTREEGIFKNLLDVKVQYYFLQKQNTFDLNALRKLRNFILENGIEIVHAHGTSWFFSAILKMLAVDFKLIWHDHYGNSEYLDKRPKKILRIFSRYFDGLICVNEKLEKWATSNLHYDKVIFLNNFILLNSNDKDSFITNSECLNIVCLANLRPQKNHLLLLEVLDDLIMEFNFKLHIIGKGFNDDYSKKIKEAFSKRDYIIDHGEILEPFSLVKKMDLGVLASNSEGLPLAILEYGMAGIAVITTNVGECGRLVGDHGGIVPPNNAKSMYRSIKKFIQGVDKYSESSILFQKKIIDNYSSKAIIPLYEDFLRTVC